MTFLKYNKANILILLLFIIGVSFSCNNNTQPNKKQELIKEANTFMNRNIQFASLFSNHQNTLDTILWNKRNKIILYLDSLNCTSCTFNEIRKWNAHNNELKDLNTDIVIICNYPDTKAIYHVKKVTHVNYPIFFDKENQFKFLNDIPQETMFQTFAIGSTNQVIWVGLPIRSPKSWKDFCTMIKQLNIQK